MKWWGYLIFGLLTAIVAPVSALLALTNPVSIIFIESIAAPIIEVFGFTPPAGWAGMTPHAIFSFIWPLTLAPIHWLNYKILRWNIWSYVGILLVINLAIACVVLALYS